MPQNRWTGVLAHVHRPDRIGRTLELLHIEDTPLPLVRDYHDPDGTSGIEVVGTVEHVATWPDGAIRGSGFTTLEPGEYEAGVRVTATAPAPRTPGATRGTLAGAAVTSQPAFDDALIRVWAA